MRRITVIIAAMCCFSFCSIRTGNIDSLLDTSEAILDDNPSGALSLLRAVDSMGLRMTCPHNARYALLMSIAMDKNYIAKYMTI